MFAGEFGAEISALLTANSKVVHSSFWDGDLESFIVQNGARGLPARSTMIYTAGETAMFRLGAKIPDGTIIGARGPHGVMAPDTPLNKWFRGVYEDRFATAPTYPAYHMAQSILGLKAAWDKAAADKGGQQPAIDDVVKAFEGLEFEGPSAKIRMAIGNGHQGIADIAYGSFRFNKAENKAEIVDVVRYRRRVRESSGQHDLDRLARGRHARGQVQLDDARLTAAGAAGCSSAAFHDVRDGIR